MKPYQEIIDKYYPAGSTLRDIYMRHCQDVAALALEIVQRRNLNIDPAQVEAAAMLHDIGIFLTDAVGIHCHGTEPYIKHGVLGADLLRSEGVDESIAAVAERHTGAGILPGEIEMLHLPLPQRNYMPTSLLERLVCYADKFFSKSGDMRQKSLERVRASMVRHGGDTLKRFEELHNEFAIDRTMA